MLISMVKVGQESEKILLWRVTRHQYGIWGPGRVLLESDQDYKVVPIVETKQ